MENTIEKLNQNRLMELTEEDLENIKNNAELKSLYLLKIKEGHDFSIEDAGGILDELMFDPEYIYTIFEQVRKQSLGEFLDFYSYPEAELKEQLPEESYKKLVQFLQDTLPDTINSLRELPELSNKITNPTLCQAIIDNKLEQHYGALKIDNPSPEIEQLFIEAIKNNKYKRFYTITDNILETLKETEQLAAAAYGIDPNNSYYSEIIISAIEEGKVLYDEVDYNFIKAHKNDLRMIKQRLRSSKHFISFEDEEMERAEVRQLIIEEIERNHALANEWQIQYYCSNYPEIAIAIVKYWDPEKLEYAIKYDSNMLGNTLKTHKPELIAAIIYNLQNNIESTEKIFTALMKCCYDHHEIFKELASNKVLFQHILPKIPIETILKYFISSEYISYNNYRYYINEELYEILSSSDIHMTSIPKDFNFKVEYPDNIWLAIIEIISPEQLNDNNLPLERFNEKPHILDAIFKKLIEFKSNKYNSVLERFNGTFTPFMIETICSQENPLNITTAQKLRILPLAKVQDTKHIIDVLNNAEELDTNSIHLIIPTLFQMTNVEEIKQICNVLFPKIKYDDNIISYLSSISADVAGTLKNTPEGEKPNISEANLTIYYCLQDFLKTQKNIPLLLTQNFSEETVKLATYSNLEALTKNPNLFLTRTTSPHHFVNFIKECQDKGLPMDLKLIYKAARESVTTRFYEYKNVTFTNDKETYDILYNLLNDAKTNDPKLNIISLWVNKHLDYHFFDCQTSADKQQFMNLLILQDEYIDKVLDAIKSDKITDTTVLNTVVLETLITEYSNEKIKTKIENTIFDLIQKGKINIFSPNYKLETFLEHVNNPIFINYVIDTCIKPRIAMHTGSVKHFLKYPQYKQATLDAITQNTNLYSRSDILELTIEYPEIKQYVISCLEQDKNGWVQFQHYYIEKDLLPAYLKNNSIDTVITYFVHNTNLTVITPEINTIIKNEFFNKHPEYKKESYELLESLYGIQLIPLLETDNIKKLISQDKEVIEKFIEIFKVRKLDENMILSALDSFKQNRFNIDNVHIINFYTHTLEKIQRGITEEEIKEVIDTLLPVIPKKLEEDIKLTGNEYLLHLYLSSKEEFLRQLIIELANNQNIYAPLFNKITTNLITQKRNDYRNNQNIYTDTNIEYELDTKSLYEAIFNYLVRNESHKILDMLTFTDNDTDLNYYTVCFLSGATDQYPQEEIPKIKRNIPVLKKIVIERITKINERDNQQRNSYSYYNEPGPKKFPNLPRRYEYLLDNPDFLKQIRKTPIYPKRKELSQTIGDLNLVAIFEMMKDEEKYNYLINLLNKYSFLDWGNIFENVIKDLSLGEDSINIYNFINAFSKVYDNERKLLLRKRKELIKIVVDDMRKNGRTEQEITEYIRAKENEPIEIEIKPYKILKYCTIYSSIANYYKLILGLEDFDLVKKNDTPNTATRGTQEQRLQNTSEMQIKMMEFNEVTVPSFIYDHKIVDEETKESKTLQATVGNKADSRNLTHGERTGACMRSYGHAFDLFEFCNTDPRGFHITFTDPITNEYVSRVSGFRNGNTIFLNQLRNSTNPKYTSEDVVAACKQVAQELIERSKDSEMPIENVVASPSFALSGYETQQLSEHNIGIGVYTGYKDVTQNAVVLATIGENGKAVDLKLDGENQPIYESVRLKPREYNGPEITESVKISIQRISAIKECIANKENPEYYKTLDFDYEILDTQYTHIIIGQDWYCALDINGNLTHDIAVQNEHSIEELNEALAKMNTLREEQIKLGGITNGIQQ